MSWGKRFSPFGFVTLEGLPKIPWALPFVILFFCLIWRGYERNVDAARIIHGAASCFTYRIRVEKKPLPEILILGGSTNGRGIVRDVLANRLKQPVAKATVSTGWLWEAHQILKRYPEETKNVKLVCINFRGTHLRHAPYLRSFQNGNTFHALKDVTDMSSENLLFFKNLRNRFKEFPNQKFPNQSPLFLPMKLPVKRIVQFAKEVPFDLHEDQWDVCIKMTDKTMLAKWRKAQASSKEPESHLEKYSDEMEAAIWDFVNYCQSRDIFVVFNITPTLYKFPALKPEGKVLTEADHRFLALCQALERAPNCAVVYLKNFHVLDPQANDTMLMYDQVHMTLKGATIHTNWLADQMLNNQKIVAVLKTPRKPEEFFVKKYAKRALRPVAKWLHKPPVPKEEPKAVMVAAPPGNVRR